ncbi:MAG TPA: flagellar hook-basal body protein [Opitutaceae bacterium]|jgi:flagellar basal body rod protein FlgG
MNIGMYQSAASLNALERWQDAVSQNITSAQVTGYRQRTVEFSASPTGEWDLNSADQGDESVPAQFPMAVPAINYTGGETTPTQRDLDVAIQGDGFFKIQAPDGTISYSRSGEFKIGMDHTISSGGGQVMSTSDSPITLLPTAGKVVISPDGTVMQGSTVLGKLALEKFASNSDLIPVAGGTFIPKDGAQPTAVEKPDLIQGYLEGSNVTPMREMVDMVVISRSYEANQKIIKSTDEQMQKTLDALG